MKWPLGAGANVKGIEMKESQGWFVHVHCNDFLVVAIPVSWQQSSSRQVQPAKVFKQINKINKKPNLHMQIRNNAPLWPVSHLSLANPVDSAFTFSLPFALPSRSPHFLHESSYPSPISSKHKATGRQSQTNKTLNDEWSELISVLLFVFLLVSSSSSFVA